MSLISKVQVPCRISQRITAWNSTNARCFQNVGMSYQSANLKSSFSTQPSMDTDNCEVEIIEGPKAERMNLFTAINDALSIALKTDPSSILFGQGELTILTFFVCSFRKAVSYYFPKILVQFLNPRRGFRWCLSMHTRSSRKVWI